MRPNGPVYHQSRDGRAGGGYMVLPTFDAELKSAKIQNSLFPQPAGIGTGPWLVLSRNVN